MSKIQTAPWRYSIGKIMAERAFAAARANGRWDAITCCPGDNVLYSPDTKKSVVPGSTKLKTMLLGRYSQNIVGAYRPWYTVDVRDVAWG